MNDMKPIILMDTVSVSLHFSKGLAELLQVIERFRNCTEYPYSVLVCNVMYSIISTKPPLNLVNYTIHVAEVCNQQIRGSLNRTAGVPLTFFLDSAWKVALFICSQFVPQFLLGFGMQSCELVCRDSNSQTSKVTLQKFSLQPSTSFPSLVSQTKGLSYYLITLNINFSCCLLRRHVTVECACRSEMKPRP